MANRKEVQPSVRIFRSYAELLALAFQLKKQTEDEAEPESKKQA